MKEYKDKYDLHLFTEEIRALTGKELENYIIALSKYDKIYLDDEYFSKLMKYGKKTETKKILKQHNIKPEKTGKYKKGKESYEMHPSIGEIKKLTGEDLENYIEALMKFNMIEKDNPAFEKLMKYGKKRELKEILGRLGIKNPTQTSKGIKNSTQTAKINGDGKIEYGAYVIMHTIPALIGFVFLLWLSTSYVWFLALLFTICTGLFHAYIDSKTGVGKKILLEVNPFTIFAMSFAAVIYFSAPFTDNAAYCAKANSKTYVNESFEGFNSDGSYNISKDYYDRPGIAGCYSTGFNFFFFAVFSIIALIQFFKAIFLYVNRNQLE